MERKPSAPGMMDQPIEFLSVMETVDAAGAVTVASETPFVTSRPLWARVERKGGVETDEADLPTAQSQIYIETRFVPGVVTSMRVAWQNQQWEIKHVDLVARDDRCYLVCERRGESGDGGARP